MLTDYYLNYLPPLLPPRAPAVYYTNNPPPLPRVPYSAPCVAAVSLTFSVPHIDCLWPMAPIPVHSDT